MQVNADVSAILATITLSFGDFRHNAITAIRQAESPRKKPH
jgi:hypothetical protein